MLTYLKKDYEFKKVTIKNEKTNEELGILKNVTFNILNDYEFNNFRNEWSFNLPENLEDYEDEILEALDELDDKELEEKDNLTISIYYNKE